MRLSFRLEHNRPSFLLSIEQCIDFSRGNMAITGPIGCGKSTLLRLIAGLEHGKGHIQFAIEPQQLWLKTNTGFGARLKHKGLSIEQRNVGYICQQSPLIPFFSVKQCLQLAYDNSSKAIWSVEEILLQFNWLSELLEQRVSELSGGQKQTLAIAMAFLSHPQLMIWDEAFSAMDESTKHNCLMRCKSLLKQGNIPLIFVSHSALELRYLCEQIILLDEGKLEYIGDINTGLIRYNRSMQLQVENFCSNLQITKAVRQGFYHADASGVTIKGVARVDLFEEQRAIARFNAVDASIFLKEPDGTSISNCLPVVVHSVEEFEHEALLTVTLNEQRLTVLITPESVEQLELLPGKRVFLLIKATAVEFIPG